MPPRTRPPLFVASVVLLADAATWLLADRLEDTIFIPLDHPAIEYAGSTTDPMGPLAKRLESGQLTPDYAADGWGYLTDLLKEFGINSDSQVLVFSKTRFSQQLSAAVTTAGRERFPVFQEFRPAWALRDFDFKTRLFRYPLSYMIYSAAFDGMPDLVRDLLYRRPYNILTGRDSRKSGAVPGKTFRR